MPSFWLVAILSCIRNAFFGLVYSLCQKIIGCIPYTEIWSSQISNKLFLNLETSTRWHSLFFPKSQLVVPYTAFLVRDNACIPGEAATWHNETVHLQIHAGMNFPKNSCWHEFFFHVGMNFFISRNSCWHEFSQNHWFPFLTPYLGHQTSQNPLPIKFWVTRPYKAGYLTLIRYRSY